VDLPLGTAEVRLLSEADYALGRLAAATGIVEEVTGRTRGQVFVARDILGFVGRNLAEPAR
jgi:hypothetical protein